MVLFTESQQIGRREGISFEERGLQIAVYYDKTVQDSVQKDDKKKRRERWVGVMAK